MTITQGRLHWLGGVYRTWWAGGQGGCPQVLHPVLPGPHHDHVVLIAARGIHFKCLNWVFLAVVENCWTWRRCGRPTKGWRRYCKCTTTEGRLPLNNPKHETDFFLFSPCSALEKTKRRGKQLMSPQTPHGLPVKAATALLNRRWCTECSMVGFCNGATAVLVPELLSDQDLVLLIV